MPTNIDPKNIFLQALVEKSPDFIFIKDRQSRFVAATKAHAQFMLGLNAPEEALGKTDFDLFPKNKEDAQRFFDEEQKIMETGQPVLNREWQVPIVKTGKTIWVSEHKLPITGETGQIVGLLGMSRDITPLKQLELEREGLLRSLQVTIDVNRAISSLLEPQELTKQTVELLHERFALYYVGLFLVSKKETLYERAGEYAYLRAATSGAGQEMLASRHKLRVGGDSMVGRCTSTGKPRFSNNVAAEKIRFAHPFLPETRSEMVLPLISRNETIGALDVQSTQENAFSEQDLSVLQIVAGQLAVALENASLYKQVEDELEKMKTDMKRYIQTGWDDYLGKGKRK
jgi:PAS domain S-box-containing protein